MYVWMHVCVRVCAYVCMCCASRGLVHGTLLLLSELSNASCGKKNKTLLSLIAHTHGLTKPTESLFLSLYAPLCSFLLLSLHNMIFSTQHRNLGNSNGSARAQHSNEKCTGHSTSSHHIITRHHRAPVPASRWYKQA
jgi:hypothetical protein